MRSGVIKLFYKGQVQRQVIYDDPKNRRQIIETWRKLYGMKFEECVIQVRPYVGKRVYRQLEAA